MNAEGSVKFNHLTESKNNLVFKLEVRGQEQWIEGEWGN